MNVAIFTVGSNPLPIYVVAKYLLDNSRGDVENLPVPDEMVFIFSKNTEEYYKKLRLKLRNHAGSNNLLDINLGDKERDREIVQNAVKFKLENLISGKEHINSIHLHYSGGTKPMSVFSYVAVEEFGKKHGIKTIYSDLDPEQSFIRIGNETYPIGRDLRDCIKLNINEIFELHNMTIDNSGSQTYTFPNINIKDFSSNAIRSFNTLRSKNEPNWKLNINKMKNKIENYYETKHKPNLPKNEIEKFREDFNIVQQEFGKKLMPVKWQDVASNPQLFTDFVEFFHGKWLEDYVLDALLSLQQKLKIDEIKKSVKAMYKRRPCEIDVIAMRGYQMHYFTCTTSKDIKKVKGKAFEALYRAEQLGGSHARVIVVSLLPSIKDPQQSDHCIENLEKDLSSFEAQIEKKVKLIGSNVLEDPALLSKEIENIFLS
ncbi:MAG: hypothetical protein C0P66_013060 [Bacillaceae bacterium]